MSSDSEQSLREKTKAYQKRKTERLDPTDPEEAFDYHQGKILQEAEEASESDAFYLTANLGARFGAVIGLFLLGFIGSAVAVSPITAGMASIYGFMLAGVGFLFLTRTGVATRRAFSSISSNNQQHLETSSEPKRICSHCGWQNPTENAYCHDCGERMESG